MSSLPEPPAAPDSIGERVRRSLEQLRTSDESDLDAGRWAFREAAALRVAFDPTTLATADGDADVGGAVLALLDDCSTVGAPTRRMWTLKPEVRTATLRHLHDPDRALAALEANRPSTWHPLERTLQAYLRGEVSPLKSQSLEELGRTLQAVRWLRELEGVRGLPEVEDVAVLYRRRQLFDPLESLVGTTFQGRRRELSELRLHVGVLDVGTVSTRWRKTSHSLNVFRDSMEDPLVVHGPPGIGKSTLLARFVLDHARAEDLRIPFAYLDFERPTLSAQEPPTLIAEAARQLAVQHPEADAALSRVADDAAKECRRQREVTFELEALEHVSAARAGAQRDIARSFRSTAMSNEAELVARLVSALVTGARLDEDEPPLLLVLDSFEQAQYRSSPHLRRLWNLFDAFQRAYSRVRIVISGRAPVKEIAGRKLQLEQLRLEELDRDAAEGLLRAEGVEDARLLKLLADRFGGNPLSLKLAAGNARREGDGIDWVNDARGRWWFLQRADETQIQGRLYLRLLGSVDDAEVAALAHPGLALRHITADVIREVMAGPCGVDVPDAAAADALFERFASHLDLAQRDGGTLMLRADVRREMLPFIARDKPLALEKLQRAAVAYYARCEGAEARAEEIYHRLRLGEPPREVDGRWCKAVGDHLWGAGDELPARAAAYLAAKLDDARVTPDSLRDADIEDWEVLTAREVEDLLDRTGDERDLRRNAEAALKLMSQRSGWTAGSPLYRLKAQALETLGRLQAAEETVQEGVDAIDDQRAPATAAVSSTLLDLLVLGASLLRRRGEAADADRRLEHAELLADRLGRGLDALAMLLVRVNVAGTAHGSQRESLATRAAQRFLELPPEDLRDQPALVRSMAVELGRDHPDVLVRAIEILGLVEADPERLAPLATQVERLMERDREFAAWLERYASQHGIPLKPPERNVQHVLARLAKRRRLDDLAKVLVGASGEDYDVRNLVIELLPQSIAETALGSNLGTALSS